MEENKPKIPGLYTKAFLIGLSSVALFLLVWLVFLIPLVDENSDSLQRRLFLFSISISLPTLFFGYISDIFKNSLWRYFFVTIVTAIFSVIILSFVSKGDSAEPMLLGELFVNSFFLGGLGFLSFLLGRILLFVKNKTSHVFVFILIFAISLVFFLADRYIF